ncbi:hypothetical protein [Paenibacillus kribbensis]|uniref:hypothetical protein n=1 Tax=Paenibacillus kribbensis TaxID=172713 RepID=UPI0012FD8463|nr:hypothetical protein [Paenibacillus kribbensis]
MGGETLRGWIILTIAVATGLFGLSFNGKNPVAKANAIASPERFHPLRYRPP